MGCGCSCCGELGKGVVGVVVGVILDEVAIEVVGLGGEFV